jgi:hypothetical protein
VQNIERIQFFFIVTYGRSGSTLLQGILNSADDIHCAGENGDFLYNLFLAQKTLEDIQQRVGYNAARKPTEPFFGIDFMDPDQFRLSIRQLVEQMVLASCPLEKTVRYAGFKEIRYPYKDDLATYLDFIDRAFSKPAFLILLRDLDDVLSSGMFADLPSTERKGIRKLFLRFEETALEFARGKPNCATLRYEWFVTDPQRVLHTLQEVGLPVDQDNITETLKVPHSYTWKQKNV